MTSTDQAQCPDCGNMVQPGQPFCPHCGTLSPAVLSPGNLCVEIPDIASEQIRTDVTKLLKSWFPNLDTGTVEEALKTQWVTLIAGIDEESGERILDALKVLKVRGRLVSQNLQESWPSRLWNPGLLISAVALVSAPFFGGLFAFFAIIAAVGAPVVWALRKDSSRRPVVAAIPSGLSSDQWTQIAEGYASVLKELGPADAEILVSIASAAFDIQTRLRSDSIAATLAGGEKGDLFKNLQDTIRTAVELCRRKLTIPEQERASVSAELQSLRDTMMTTAEWYRTLESDRIKSAEELQGELSDITRRMDALVREVKSPLDERPFIKEKPLL